MGSNFDFHARAHAEHRKRVLTARPIIDNKPPLLHAGNYSGFAKLKEDVDTYVHRNLTNTNMLVELNRILRTRGATDSFRTPLKAMSNTITTSVPRRIKELERIERENMTIGRSLLCITAKVDSWQTIPLRQDKERDKENKQSSTTFVIPHEILGKYTNLDIPQDPVVLQTLLRPKIWFDLEVKALRPLGRIVMQLFTEAAPQVVLEFVRLCNAQQQDRLQLVRLFPALWVEGEVQLRPDTLVSKNIEYDKRVVDHGTHTGVLSFSLDQLKLCREGFINYAISFKPLKVLNGQRVGFGRVVKGLKILNCIQDYGTKNGKPTKDVIVASCGLYKPT